MTIENARRAGMLSDKLRNIDNMIDKTRLAMEDLSDCGTKMEVKNG